MNTSSDNPLPPVLGSAPPPAESNRPPGSLRQLVAMLLSVCLGLFLADAVISLADDTAAMLSGVHILLSLRLFVGLFAVLLAIVVYVLMAFTPAIPKRWFVPLALFYLFMELAGLPIFFLGAGHLTQIACVVSLVQVLLGLWILYHAQGGWKFGWPLVPVDRLQGRRFSWRNLVGFSLVNILGLLPAVLIYLFLSTAALVNHFTDGFMTLHPGGFTMQVRKYVRADGKTIQLFPMAHVAEADFYQRIARTFPTNSIILMEGVTDKQHLLKHKINYQRMARTLGLAEQHEQFEPTRGEMVMADVDVGQFSTNTLALLNLITLVHTGGADMAALQQMMQISASPNIQEHLLNDLLGLRNKHLLAQIQQHLTETEHLVVPWGVAHMPEIAREIQKSGFRLQETQEYEVIRFHGPGQPAMAAKQ